MRILPFISDAERVANLLMTARFVPFAIFVSSASLLIILTLFVILPLYLSTCLHLSAFNCYRLISTLFKQRSPISTRIELACLGLLAVLWLALGSFLAASASAEADVECFSSDSSLEDPVEFPGCELSSVKFNIL